MERYGKRIKGTNGHVVWCELSQEEVAKALLENVKLNAMLFEQCFRAAIARVSNGSQGDQASVALNPQARREILEVASALFEQCGIKGFVAIQQALDSKAHWHKVNNMV